MSGAAARPQLSAEQVKAQRAAKQAEKAARVAAALEKKKAKSSGGAAPASSPSSLAVASGGANSHSSSPSLPPKAKPSSRAPSVAASPALGGTQGAGAMPPLALGERRGSVAGAQGAGGKQKKDPNAIKRPSPMLQFDDPKRAAAFDKKAVVHRTAVQKSVPLFSHLPQYERETSLSLKLRVGFSSEELHPAILRVGLQYASGAVSGANARCVAMLTALKQFICDYRTPPSKLLRDDLLAKLRPLVRFLIDSRPQSISMGHAIRYLKMRISQLRPEQSESSAKEALLQHIDQFLQERIELADEVIASHAASKINDGDVVLTYATSHVVEQMLLRAANEQGKKFRLIIVDARPKLEGKELMQRLVAKGLSCTYIMLNALSYVMKDVSKVFLGAAAMLSNGSVISRVGSAVVAMMAKTHHVPLLICCETYKFSERVQLDSIGFNELGDPDELLLSSDVSSSSSLSKVSPLRDWRDLPNVKLLHLVYDLTPVEFVTMVITEVGMIPPTSVPVIIREQSQREQNHA